MIKQHKKAPVIAAMAFGTLLSQAAWANEETTLLAPVFEANELSAAFEPSAEPMQMLALSEQEMKETEGAVWNFFAGAIGGGIFGAGTYAYNNWSNNSYTWQGFAYAAGTGALVGSGGAALIARAGGGLLGNVAWRPSMMATNAAFSQYSSYRHW